MQNLLSSTVCLILLACGDAQIIPRSTSTSPHRSDTAKNMQPRNSESSFPQLASANQERAFPDALLVGTLLKQQDCLRVAPSEGGPSYLIVWPPQVTLETRHGRLKVFDRDNQSAASEGEKIILGGGEVDSSAQILRELRQPLPRNCTGPIWLASGILSSAGE